MERQRLSDWMSFIGIVGVIAGLVLVAYELRQNSDLMRIQIGQARADAAMISNEQLFNSDHVPAILARIQEGSELAAVDRIRFISFFRAFNRNQDNVLSQYRAGMLDANTPRSVADYACDFVNASPEHRKAWELTKVGYTDAYVVFIEDALTGCR